MNHLFTPWRFPYVISTRDKDKECELCRVGSADPTEDEKHFIIYRDELLFVVLNIYPYTSGHLMIVPYEHKPLLSQLPQATLREVSVLASRVESLLAEHYRPDGINMGLNLGLCAGAGIIEHVHMHIVPRWYGDTSFMTVTGRTRVIPEELHDTWSKLQGQL